MTVYSKRIEAAERVELRHWLRERGIEPAEGQEYKDTVKLVRQVLSAGGDPMEIMDRGKAKIDKEIAEQKTNF